MQKSKKNTAHYIYFYYTAYFDIITLTSIIRALFITKWSKWLEIVINIITYSHWSHSKDRILIKKRSAI